MHHDESRLGEAFRPPCRINGRQCFRWPLLHNLHMLRDTAVGQSCKDLGRKKNKHRHIHDVSFVDTTYSTKQTCANEDSSLPSKQDASRHPCHRFLYGTQKQTGWVASELKPMLSSLCDGDGTAAFAAVGFTEDVLEIRLLVPISSVSRSLTWWWSIPCTHDHCSFQHLPTQQLHSCHGTTHVGSWFPIEEQTNKVNDLCIVFCSR